MISVVFNARWGLARNCIVMRKGRELRKVARVAGGILPPANSHYGVVRRVLREGFPPQVTREPVRALPSGFAVPYGGRPPLTKFRSEGTSARTSRSFRAASPPVKLYKTAITNCRARGLTRVARLVSKMGILSRSLAVFCLLTNTRRDWLSCFS